MEQTEIAQSIIIKKPVGLRGVSMILLLESLFFSFFLVLSIFNVGIKSFFTANTIFETLGILLLLLPVISIPFCFLVSNMKKVGLYGIVTIVSTALCIALIYLITILSMNTAGSFIAGVLFLLLMLVIIINLPILIYLLSIRKKFI